MTIDYIELHKYWYYLDEIQLNQLIQLNETIKNNINYFNYLGWNSGSWNEVRLPKILFTL